MEENVAFELLVFRGEKVLFIYLAFGDNSTLFSDLSVLAGDLFLGAYPFSHFIKEHTSGGNLHIGFE